MLIALDCSGPERCMLESNFPVDTRSISYCMLWNALKKITAPFSETEQHAMFYANAQRVYRLQWVSPFDLILSAMHRPCVVKRSRRRVVRRAGTQHTQVLRGGLMRTQS